MVVVGVITAACEGREDMVDMLVGVWRSCRYMGLQGAADVVRVQS